MMKSLLYSLVLFSVAGVSAVVAKTTPQNEQQKEDIVLPIARELIDWVREGGGIWSDSLEVRRRIPGDASSPSGIFAKRSITENEVIVQVPSHLFISVPLDLVDWNVDEEGEEQRESWTAYYANTCTLAKELLKETQLYRESPSLTWYSPYIKYLEETQPKGQIPATYSDAGKKLLRQIQGRTHSGTDDGANDYDYDDAEESLEPLLPHIDLVDWIDHRLVERNCFTADDADAYHAASLVVQRGFDLDLIPLWDMVNHEVEDRVNIETNAVRDPEGFRVWAKRDIQAGEEIFYSYNYCADCENVGEDFGTPGIYKDFGFLESYPQEWAFPEMEVYATIEKDEASGRYEAKFSVDVEKDEKEESGSRSYYYAPDPEDIDYFLQHLSRLGQSNIKAQILALESPYEQFMIARYYESLVIALSSIVRRGSELSHEMGSPLSREIVPFEIDTLL